MPTTTVDQSVGKVQSMFVVIEKTVAFQLIAYLDRNNLLLTLQSVFHKGHSTDTLLVRLLSGIYGAIDRSPP